MNKVTVIFSIFALIIILFIPELVISHENREHSHTDGEVIEEPNPNKKGLIYGLLYPLISIEVLILLIFLPMVAQKNKSNFIKTDSGTKLLILKITPLILFALLFTIFGVLANLGIITEIDLLINDVYLISFSLFIIGLSVLTKKIPSAITIIPILLIAIISGTATGINMIGKEENILFAIGFLASILLIEGFGQFLSELANKYKFFSATISLLAIGICCISVYTCYADYTDYKLPIFNSGNKI